MNPFPCIAFSISARGFVSLSRGLCFHYFHYRHMLLVPINASGKALRHKARSSLGVLSFAQSGFASGCSFQHTPGWFRPQCRHIAASPIFIIDQLTLSHTSGVLPLPGASLLPSLQSCHPLNSIPGSTNHTPALGPSSKPTVCAYPRPFWCLCHQSFVAGLEMCDEVFYSIVASQMGSKKVF